MKYNTYFSLNRKSLDSAGYSQQKTDFFCGLNDYKLYPWSGFTISAYKAPLYPLDSGLK